MYLLSEGFDLNVTKFPQKHPVLSLQKYANFSLDQDQELSTLACIISYNNLTMHYKTKLLYYFFYKLTSISNLN